MINLRLFSPNSIHNTNTNDFVDVKYNFDRPILDNGTSVITFTAAAPAPAAMFPIADAYMNDWVENMSQYN